METVDIIDAMMSPIVPMSRKQERDTHKAERDRAAKMSSDTQILLAIFEKVVCIEDHMKSEGKQEVAAPDPVQLSLDAFAGGM